MPDVLPTYLTVQTTSDVDRYMELVRGSAAKARAWMLAHDGDPLDLFRQLKFDAVGFHPVDDRPLNLIEQLNQTWTYAVALEATRTLLHLHPTAGGFLVAPGAHMSLPLDIMSVAQGEVGAETFAAVDPRNNGKLAKDIAKLSLRPELHRYAFFAAPAYPRTERQPKLEKGGVQVWSVAL